jgi:threonine dehydratase
LLFLDSHLREIRAAALRIDGYTRHTPLLATDLGDQIFVKAECLQPTGSFKVRGAFNSILSIRAQEPDINAVLASSSGNHGQAVAYAARRLNLKAVIVMPDDSNPVKVAGVREQGAEIVDGVTWENREQVVETIRQDRGLPIIHPFNDWRTIHGQGTIATEVVADRPDVGMIVAPVGGGGLLSGIALAAKALSQGRVKVIGVEPAAANDASESLRAGVLQSLETAPDTLADGVRAKHIGDKAFDVLVKRGYVDAIVTVSEEEILAAVGVVWRQLHVVVEPTGALPVAALIGGKLPMSRLDAPVALVLSGGNIDPAIVPMALEAAQEMAPAAS